MCQVSSLSLSPYARGHLQTTPWPLILESKQILQKCDSSVFTITFHKTDRKLWNGHCGKGILSKQTRGMCMSIEYIYSYYPLELQSTDLASSVVYGEQTYTSEMYYWNFIAKHSLSHSAFGEVFSTLGYVVPLKGFPHWLLSCHPQRLIMNPLLTKHASTFGVRKTTQNTVQGPAGDCALWFCLGLSSLPQHPTLEIFTTLGVSLGFCIFIEDIYSFCSQGVVLVSHKPETKYLLYLFSITRHFAKFFSSTTKLQGILCGIILGFTNETKNPKTLDF